MGWPRKNERARLYRLPGNDFRLYFAHEGIDPTTGNYNASLANKFKSTLTCIKWSKEKKVFELHWEEFPKTYGGSAKRVSWNDLPGTTQQYFKKLLGDTPNKYPGFFRIGERYREQKELSID